MISKISIYDYFILKNTSLECKKYNLLFGYNGTGKSTLSKLFQDIMSNIKDKERYEVFYNSNERSYIKVYDGRNYMKDNFYSVDQISFYIGSEAISLNNSIKNIYKEIDLLNENSSNNNDEQISKIKSYEDKLHFIYKDISSKIVEMFSMKTQECNTLTISKEYENNKNFKSLNDIEYNKCKENGRNKDNKTNIDCKQELNMDFKKITEEASQLLKIRFTEPINLENTFSDFLEKYKNKDLEFQNWIKKGLEYKEFEENKICPFCFRKLDNLFQNFIDYFKDKTKENTIC